MENIGCWSIVNEFYISLPALSHDEFPHRQQLGKRVLLLVGGYCIKGVGKTTQRLSWAHSFKQIATLNITTFSEERQLACPAWVYLAGIALRIDIHDWTPKGFWSNVHVTASSDRRIVHPTGRDSAASGGLPDSMGKYWVL